MQIARRLSLLVFEDAVGITDGYKNIWNRLLEDTGLGSKHVHVVTRSAYRHIPKNKLLEWKKTRKQPGFHTNENYQLMTRAWVDQVFAQHKPDAVVCMDPALLFMLNPHWDQATLDRLRGGTYIHLDVPWVVTLPITAWHSKMKAKDIAKLNEGFIEKADFEEFRAEEDGEVEEDDESQMEWHEPIIVPYGRIVLEFDLQKVSRFLRRIQAHEALIS